MGVPAFYKWLSTRYPKIIKDVLEEFPNIIDGTEIPVDSTTPNPNGVEFDNLYLDMNGIIHPCFHPEDKPAPVTELAVFENIFEYIDRLFSMVRPRRLIYMAIDGVAPRAKMNQQRMRRFRAAKDRLDMKLVEEQVKEEYAALGKLIDERQEKKSQSEVWDSNTITPGTPFMFRLATALQYYIHKKLNFDKGWKDVEVILSDSNDPGEGEHKIMQFIRQQRGRPGWNPNSRHCVYGLDADLIMLSLSTHEPHFSVLREVVFQIQKDGESIKQQREELIQSAIPDPTIASVYKKPFQFLDLEILREYLKIEFLDDPGFQQYKKGVDVERVFDDFVFMCFFVGNDFLPHSPTLEIREGGISLLMQTYKTHFGKVGYLTNGSQVHLAKVEIFLEEVAKHEEAILVKRTRQLRADARRNAQRQGNKQGMGFNSHNNQQHNSQQNNQHNKRNSYPQSNHGSQVELGGSANKEAARNLRDKFKRRSDGGDTGLQDNKRQKINDNGSYRNQNEQGNDEDGEEEVDVATQIKQTLKDKAMEQADCLSQVLEEDKFLKLDEPGYKDRYYGSKLNVSTDLQEAIVKNMVKSYIEGVCWVMSYYYEGCASWSWYYPYQYAPFTSDFKDFSHLNVEFSEGTPFRPYDQLMAVLPAASAHCLPEVYRPLFTDPNSPILDFYPENFEVDMNGHRFAWQGVALLPFIDEKRLLDAIRPLDSQLNEQELSRNQRSDRLIFVSSQHGLAESFERVETVNKAVKEQGGPAASKRINIQIDASKSKGTIGVLGPCMGEAKPKSLTAPFGLRPDIENNKVFCASYHLPPYERHRSIIMEGVMLNTKLKWELHLNVPPTELWHERGKQRGNFNNQGNQQSQYGQMQGGQQFLPHVNANRSAYQYDSNNFNRNNSNYNRNQGNQNWNNNQLNIQVAPRQPPQVQRSNQWIRPELQKPPHLQSPPHMQQPTYIQQPGHLQQQQAPPQLQNHFTPLQNQYPPQSQQLQQNNYQYPNQQYQYQRPAYPQQSNTQPYQQNQYQQPYQSQNQYSAPPQEQQFQYPPQQSQRPQLPPRSQDNRFSVLQNYGRKY